MFTAATIYNMQVLFGILTFLFALKKAPNLVRIDIDQVIRFGLSCLLIFSIKAIVMALNKESSYIDQAYLEGTNSLAAVWWEDACFVLPYLLAYNYIGKKAYFLFPLFLSTNYIFMQGHAYQGPVGQITFIFPFISFYYGKKYGLGTMMLCHILYDTSIVLCLSGLKHYIAGVI